MYNPYLPQSWAEPERAQPRRTPPPDRDTPPPPPPPDYGAPPPPPAVDAKGFLSGLLERLHLEDIDTGDVLLLLILLFLFLDDREDNMELIITLGLMLIL